MTKLKTLLENKLHTYTNIYDFKIKRYRCEVCLAAVDAAVLAVFLPFLLEGIFMKVCNVLGI